MAIEIESPYLNIFEPPIENNSVESYEYVECLEVNVKVKDKNKYKIPVNDLNVWIHPHNSYIHLKGNILRSDGNNLAATDLVTLTNNGFNLFSQAKYKIGNKEIESIDYVGIGTSVMNLVEFSDDYSRSAATNMFWFRDTADSSDMSRFLYNESDKDKKLKESESTLGDFLKNSKHNHNFNEGFLERWKQTKQSKQISLFLPLSRLFGFCKDINRIFKGLTHQIELEKNIEHNFIHKSDTSASSYKFEISHISWFVPIVTPALKSLAKLESQLASLASSSLCWESYNVYMTDVRTDSKSTIRITNTNHKPSHVYIVFQKSIRDENQFETNMIFDNMELTKIQIKVGNQKFPIEPYSCNFSPENLDCSRVYASFLSAGYKNIDVDTGTAVSYSDFIRLYPIFHFDLTSQETSIFENQATPNIDVMYTLSSPKLPIRYNMYCIIVNERKATIQAIDEKINVIL